ncbi:MAG: glycoside hydrolase family 88 protein, partial [Chloroflexi bacterium]|nr:glycoside hydrolase family 88 protein [Chloroflexota bacterium]
MEPKPLSIALAETILKRYPDPDDIPYRRWCYVQGYVLCAFERLWEYTGDRRYFEYLARFVNQHVLPDGSVCDFTGDSLDDIMAGTTIVALYEHTGEPQYRLAAERIRAAFERYPRNRDGGFWHAKALPHEMWVDGVFMGGMFLVRYGRVLGDRSAFDEVAHQIVTFAGNCRKGTSGLYLHAYDEAKAAFWADPDTGLSAEVWSEGLGWYALILIETLAALPADHPQRGVILRIFEDLAEGLRTVQDPSTGLWYQVVDKGYLPDNWHDTSGSAMFVYAMQRAVDLGYLPNEPYASVARKGFEGIMTKAIRRHDGLVDIYDACDGVCVQKSYADYVHYPKVVNA